MRATTQQQRAPARPAPLPTSQHPSQELSAGIMGWLLKRVDESRGIVARLRDFSHIQDGRLPKRRLAFSLASRLTLRTRGSVRSETRTDEDGWVKTEIFSISEKASNTR